MNTLISKFKLNNEFKRQIVRQFKQPFKNNGLGDFVNRRTYSRPKEDGSSEDFNDIIIRVVEGTMNMQRRHFAKKGLSFIVDPAADQEKAQELAECFLSFKALPPGRGLWAMGSSLTEERELYAALNNCAFVSTLNMASTDPVKPFTFLMDMSMMGVGTGFDTKGANSVLIPHSFNGFLKKHVIADSREGWVDAFKVLLEHYFKNKEKPVFDFSEVRAAGLPIKGFGGISGGPEPLREMLEKVAVVLDQHRGQMLSVTGIVDIMNMVGKCIVSGNVRRTAEIAFGDADDDNFLNLKDYTVNPHRMDFGWTSNNSVFAKVGETNYQSVMERTWKTGEPGFIWLDNKRAFSRMKDPADFKDSKAAGTNPCVEQTLESYELCNLGETFPFNHDTLKDYLHTLELMHFYTKTVTLGETNWKESNAIIARNRRMGISMSGIFQFLHHRGHDELQQWCDLGYSRLQECDRELSRKWGIDQSIKLTSVKPSGTVSLLAGATPGIHAPIDTQYIRRVRFPTNSSWAAPLKRAGYKVEKAHDGHNTSIVEFPVNLGDDLRCQHDQTAHEQLENAAFMQRHWADNSVSCTVSFDPQEENPESLSRLLQKFDSQLKGISFLPSPKKGSIQYAQAPYERINLSQYYQMMKSIKPILFDHSDNFVPKEHSFCDGDVCTR